MISEKSSLNLNLYNSKMMEDRERERERVSRRENSAPSGHWNFVTVTEVQTHVTQKGIIEAIFKHDCRPLAWCTEYRVFEKRRIAD